MFQKRARFDQEMTSVAKAIAVVGYRSLVEALLEPAVAGEMTVEGVLARLGTNDPDYRSHSNTTPCRLRSI